MLPAARYLVTAAQGGANARADTAITAGRTQDLELRLAGYETMIRLDPVC